MKNGKACRLYSCRGGVPGRYTVGLFLQNRDEPAGQCRVDLDYEHQYHVESERVSGDAYLYSVEAKQGQEPLFRFSDPVGYVRFSDLKEIKCNYGADKAY